MTTMLFEFSSTTSIFEKDMFLFIYKIQRKCGSFIEIEGVQNSDNHIMQILFKIL